MKSQASGRQGLFNWSPTFIKLERLLWTLLPITITESNIQFAEHQFSKVNFARTRNASRLILLTLTRAVETEVLE